MRTRVAGLSGVVALGISFGSAARAGDGSPGAWYALAPAVSDGPVAASIDFDDEEIQGWSLGLCHDPEALRVRRFSGTDALLSVRGGYPPDFYVCEEGRDAARAGVIQAAVLSFYSALVLPRAEGGFPVLELEYDVLAESAVRVCDGLVGSGQPVVTALTVRGATHKQALEVSTSMVQKPYAGKLAYRVEPPESSEVVTVVLSSEEVQVEGWSIALCHAAGAAELLEAAASPELGQLIAGEPPELVVIDAVPADPFVAVRQRVVLGSQSSPVALGPFPEGIPVLGLRYRVQKDDVLKFCDDVGGATFDNRVTIGGIGYVPRTRTVGTLVRGALGSRFIRGDANLDERINMSDAVFVLMALFLGSAPLPCLDAADSNDVGRVDISDPIFILRHLFLGGPQPPSPYPEPGEDLSPQTALGCERGL